MLWPSLEAREKICQKKVHFLGDLKAPKFHSDINWPVAARKPKTDLETNLSVYFKSLSNQALATNDDIAPKVGNSYVNYFIDMTIIVNESIFL